MALPLTELWSTGTTQGIATYGAYAVLEGGFNLVAGSPGLEVTSGTYNTARRTDETPNAAQFSRTVITAGQIATGTYCGPAVRCQSGANSSYHVETAGSDYYVSKCLAGVQTTLFGPISLSMAAGDVLGLEIDEVSGTTTLKVYKALAASPTSFSLHATYTDTSSPITTAGYLGIFGYGNTPGTRVIGTWTAGNLVAGPSTIVVGQVTEQDIAQPIDGVNMAQVGDLWMFGDDTGNESSFGGLKLFGGSPATAATVSVGQVSESDLAQPITARLVRTVAQVTESDSAQPIAANQVRALGQPGENDAAQPIAAQLARVLGQPAELDSAQTIAAQLVRVVAQAGESDTAQPVTARVVSTVAQAAENDSAQPIAARLVLAVAQAQESDLAQPITGRLVRTVAQALETDSAQGITLGSTGLGVAQVQESDTAQPVQGLIRTTIAQVAESDAAQPIGARLVAGVGQALEGDAAQPITARLAQSVAQVQETDQAQPFLPGGFVPVSQVGEADTAQPIGATQRRTVAQATETDAAQTFVPAISATVGQARETELAQAFVLRLLQSVGQVQELDVAGAIQEPGAPEPEQPSTGTGGIGRLVTPSYRMQPPRRKRRPGEDRQQGGTAVDLAPGPLVGTTPAAAAPAPAQPAAEVDRWRLAREQDLEFETQVLHHI